MYAIRSTNRRPYHVTNKKLQSKDEDIYSDYCWTIVGSRRRKVILAFNSEKIPSEIKEATGLRFSHVSKVLREMADREIIKIIELPEGRKLYGLTEKGELIINKIQNSDGSLDSLVNY